MTNRKLASLHKEAQTIQGTISLLKELNLIEPVNELYNTRLVEIKQMEMDYAELMEKINKAKPVA